MKDLILNIIGWAIGASVLAIIGTMLWLDHQSARRHKKWMNNFTRRTNKQFSEGWEEELDVWLKGKR